jgi:malonyl-CoA O-methyltransferase
MPDSSSTEKRQMRRAFERAAGTYEEAAVLQREICDRMLARLDYIRHRPNTILDAGAGTGYGARRLSERYPGAAVAALDIAHGMLARSRALVPWWRRLLPLARPILHVCGDVESLPLRRDWASMVWSNATLQWCNDLKRAFEEVHRAMAPGGLFMFSTFGPDTLKELRQAFGAADGYTHVNRFADMHDIGDLLVQCGFATPVMDMELITMTYTEPMAVMRELKAIGAHNVTAGRRRGLMGKGAWSKFLASIENIRRDGTLPITFEVVYGHAWKPEPRLGPSGRPVIELKVKP